MSRVILANQKPLATLDDFLDTYESPDAPRTKHNLKFLQSRGILPLTFTNPNFSDINILVSFLFWSGSISNYEANVHIRREHQEIIREAAQNLELGLREARPEYLAFSENGKGYARLLTMLGIYNSSDSREVGGKDVKSRHKIELPEYVRFLVGHYAAMRGENKQIANKVLADQCRILLISRGIWIGDQYKVPMIQNRESQENVVELAEQVVKMFNTIYPSLGLNQSSIHYDGKKDGNGYGAAILFTKENIQNAMRVYNLFHIELTPRLHEAGRPLYFRGGHNTHK